VNSAKTLGITTLSVMTLSMKGLFATLSTVTLSIKGSFVTLSIMKLSIKGLFVTLSIGNKQHNNTLYRATLCSILLC
jgi:hypothetical protein